MLQYQGLRVLGLIKSSNTVMANTKHKVSTGTNEEWPPIKVGLGYSAHCWILRLRINT